MPKVIPRLIYWAEIAAAPPLAAWLLSISTLPLPARVGLFAGGVVAWTLAEYAVHRFWLHDRHSAQHRLHHAQPDAKINAIFWQIWVGFAALYVVAGGTVLAGVLGAYAWYLLVHHCAHHETTALPAQLQLHHEGHHRFAGYNYGVSTTLWDHVFDTRLPRKPGGSAR